MKVLEEVVPVTARIREVVAVINESPHKICLVVDNEGCLKRTLSDGDIRRALLEGASLEDDVSFFSHKSPVSFPKSASSGELLDSMHKNAIQVVVIHDDEFRPVGLVNRSKLEPDILLSPPHIGDTEIQYIHEAIDDNWVAPAGPHLMAFEADLARISNRSHALALSSGTAALHLALRVLEIGKGRRVYVSDLTFIASLYPILYQGAEPVLIDSEPHSWNMSPMALERRLAKDAKSGKLPAAIIVVHIYGQSADMLSLMELADQYNVPIIEDAAESLGATYENHPSGYHGLLSIYSFNGNKIITTSGGGALVSDRLDLIEKARMLATQGREYAEHYQHSELAYNYRMSNILAGIGRGQLALLEDRVSARQAVFRRYKKGFAGIDGIRFQDEVESGSGSRWLTVIDFDPDAISLHCYQFMRALRDQGIDSRPAWKPMNMQPLCAGFDLEPHSDTEIVSSSLFLRSLCLPSGSSMTEVEQDRVIEIVSTLAQTDYSIA